VIDRDQYTHPSHRSGKDDAHANGGPSKGFVVRGAPWEQNNNHAGAKHANQTNGDVVAPDTNNMDLFPTISTADAPKAAAAMSWGPARK
jgi:hypothetical protein